MWIRHQDTKNSLLYPRKYLVHFKNKGVVILGMIKNGDRYKSPEIQQLICKNALPVAELCRNYTNQDRGYNQSEQ